ncbi:MAG: ATP-NAD kinase family protein [Rubrobacteraceae bacterium]
MPPPAAPAVGVIANPASGRDIRRLVSGASVFDNAEKGSMVYRLMVGLGAVGVDRVLMMPAESGVSESLRRHLRGHASDRRPLPELETLEMRIRSDARDTVEAVEEMLRQAVAAIVVLGGDGTNRVIARHSPDVPLCSLSTGTNNAFPRMREATVAGITTGLVATGKLGDEVLRREKALRIGLNGDPDHDCALVDVAVCSERFVGARAVWRAEDVSELFVTSAPPHAVGFSSVAGMLDPVSRDEAHGLHVSLTDPAAAELTLTVPLAPGLVVPVGVAESRRIEPGVEIPIEPVSGSLALDGEREIELGPRDRAAVRLDANAPRTIDVEAAMKEAARHGLLNGML